MPIGKTGLNSDNTYTPTQLSPSYEIYCESSRKELWISCISIPFAASLAQLSFTKKKFVAMFITNNNR